MKNFPKCFLCFLFLGFLIISCNNQQEPTAISDDSNTTLNKAIIGEGEFDVDYIANNIPPYTDCITGVNMQNHGKIKAYYKTVVTPSGTYIEIGHVDYKAYGEVTLVNESTGDTWTLKNGKNPWSWIEFHNGSLRFHYHWNEVYKLGNQTLVLHVQGFFTLDKNGNVTRVLETHSCN